MTPRVAISDQAAGEPLAQFTNYREAVSFVEKMIEDGFPARFISIVGTDLRSVETVKGKLGYGRVSMSGALTGSWLGMFFGLIFGAAGSEQVLIANVGAGIVIGAGAGMLLNIVRFGLTKNRRGFISAQAVVAKSYQVTVPKEQVQLAKKTIGATKTVKKTTKKVS